ncbi:DUF3618 domain-containing protein [Phaeobacter sp. 22II1-1F12B]|uniref:DUF3618 domain-containing protein n=1 Tax=Phaeobacter sp. 22II1-1F12B TaxID=1317111 RepID=UPI000B520A99|nr:DUF3618 domain-containing protein [Phaeobacter sp. 22II1-1F12B]
MADNRTPDEIERDIERERSQLGRTVDELQDRLSPEGILREVGRGLSDHGQDIGEAVTQSVKRNPVALALTGIGLAWLVSGRSWEKDKERLVPDFSHSDPTTPAQSRLDYSRAGAEPRAAQGGYRTAPNDPATHSLGEAGLASAHGNRRVSQDWLYADDDDFWDDYDQDDQDDGPGIYDRVSDGASRAADSAREKAQKTGESVRSAGQSAADSAASARDAVSSRARRIRRRLADGTDTLSEEARERVISARWAAVRARRSAARRARSGADQAQRFFEENPLVVGGLALAAGAVLAGTLPRTRQEDDWFGKQSDRYYDKAERMLETERQKTLKVADRAAETAQEVLEEERAKIDNQAPGDKSATEHIADEVRSGVSKVADASREEAEKQKLGTPSS